MEAHGLPTELFFCEQQPRSSFQTNAPQVIRHQSISSSRLPRRDMTNLQLHLDPDPLPECFGALLGNSGQSPILGSPDLNLLRLGSPELERLIMSQPCASSQNSSIRESITSTSHQHPAFSCSNTSTISRSAKAVSPIISAQDLQFITETNNALESLVNPQRSSLHGRDSSLSLGNALEPFHQSFMEPLQQVPDDQSELMPAMVVSGLQTSYPSSRNNNQFNFKLEEVSSPGVSNDSNTSNFSRARQNFDEYKSLFEGHSGGQFPDKIEVEEEKDQSFLSQGQVNLSILPMPPIDLEVQEIVKRERKKLKNRVAASKCRKKKLEREAQLEIRVQHLKEKNIELSAVAAALRQQSLELKQRILEHINAGCHMRVMPY